MRVLKVCTVCGKISATGEDHTDCIQIRRLELEDKELRRSVPEMLGSSEEQDLGVEVRALLEHLTREKASK